MSRCIAIPALHHHQIAHAHHRRYDVLELLVGHLSVNPLLVLHRVELATLELIQIQSALQIIAAREGLLEILHNLGLQLRRKAPVILDDHVEHEQMEAEEEQSDQHGEVCICDLKPLEGVVLGIAMTELTELHAKKYQGNDSRRGENANVSCHYFFTC